MTILVATPELCPQTQFAINLKPPKAPQIRLTQPMATSKGRYATRETVQVTPEALQHAYLSQE